MATLLKVVIFTDKGIASLPYEKNNHQFGRLHHSDACRL